MHMITLKDNTPNVINITPLPFDDVMKGSLNLDPEAYVQHSESLQALAWISYIYCISLRQTLPSTLSAEFRWEFCDTYVLCSNNGIKFIVVIYICKNLSFFSCLTMHKLFCKIVLILSRNLKLKSFASCFQTNCYSANAMQWTITIFFSVHFERQQKLRIYYISKPVYFYNFLPKWLYRYMY